VEGADGADKLDSEGEAQAGGALSVGLSVRGGDASPLAPTDGAGGAAFITSMSVSAKSAICASLSSLLTYSVCQYPPLAGTMPLRGVVFMLRS